MGSSMFDPMALISERHDGGYQQEASTYPGPLGPNHTDILWEDKQFLPESMQPSHTVFGLYDDVGQPWSRIKSPKLAFTLKAEKSQLDNISEPLSTLALEGGTRVDGRVLGLESLVAPVAPRQPSLTAGLKSDYSILQHPETLDEVAELRRAFSIQSLEMDNVKFLQKSSNTAPGVGLGLGPGPRRSRSSSGTAKHDMGLHDIQTDSRSSLQKEWQRIKKLRIEIWGFRSKIQELRKSLREKQIEKSTADDRYFQYVRMRGLGITLANQDISKQQKSMIDLLRDCERIRDDYGPLEDDCNLLEDHVGREEFKLTRLEESYDKRQSHPELFEEQQQAPVSDSEEASGSESDVGQDSHPMVSQYLFKLGEVDNLRERLDDHIEEKFALEYEQESRLRVGRALAPDDEEWLNNYENLESNVLQEIDDAKAEAERLKQLCFEQGLVDKDGNPTDFEKQERQTFLEEKPEVDAGTERSEFVKFPVLLPRPGSKEVRFFRQSGPKAVEDVSHSAGDHINQWLLHRLRSSPLDVNLLASTFEAETGHPKNEEWQFDVLAFWYRDGARKGESDYRIYSSGIATQAPRRSRYSARSLSDTSERYSFGLAIRSSLLQPGSNAKSGTVGSIEPAQQIGLRPPPPFPGPKLSQSI